MSLTAMHSNKNFKLFIADDSLVVRERLVMMLDELPHIIIVGQAETVAEVVDAERGKIVGRERLQRELSGAAQNRQAPLIAVLGQLDLGALGKLAHDIVEHMGGHGGGAFALAADRHGDGRADRNRARRESPRGTQPTSVGRVGGGGWDAMAGG